VSHTLHKLGAAQAGFLHAADSVTGTDWQRRPAPSAWSAAELVAHLCQVERGILGYADRVIRKPALPVSFFGRLHLPMALVESRMVRRKAPASVQPERSNLSEKETMIAELRGIRERTLAFLEETHQRNLSRYCWRHPFLGALNFYQWFSFVPAYRFRHTKQMWEITKNLPKDVASSQKQIA